MKKLFYSGLILFMFYEFLNRYLVMSLPGSQNLNSLQFSYALSHYKFYIELALLFFIAYTAIRTMSSGKTKIPLIFILISTLVYIFFNFFFTAENVFRQPKNLIFQSATSNTVNTSTLIIGIELEGKAKAYPVPFIRYHHQVVDNINGEVILVTYCGLCRSGRIFKPYIEGEYTTFRLVGVNHFNAMFEDKITKSWWSQETGICIAGKLKGSRLTEINSSNMVLKTWMTLYPETEIMQPDPAFTSKYHDDNDYSGDPDNRNNSSDENTWSAHSFVIGVAQDTNAIAIDWNVLVKERIINEPVGNTGFILVISDDNKSFAAFENPEKYPVKVLGDTIFLNENKFDLSGRNLAGGNLNLKRLNAYREYWFSWLYAHPNTKQHFENKSGF